MVDDKAALQRFSRELSTRIRNGVDEARPHAEAWLAVVQVSCLLGVPGYVTADVAIGPPETGILPVVEARKPFNLEALEYSATWEDGDHALVRWNNGREHLDCTELFLDGNERTVRSLYCGAVLALFRSEAEAVSWAARRAGELHAAHLGSVERNRAHAP